MAFATFRHTETGVITDLPEHYADHPVFGKYLELYVPDAEEWEEDKVVSDDHTLPLEQRITIKAVEADAEWDSDDKEDE